MVFFDQFCRTAAAASLLFGWLVFGACAHEDDELPLAYVVNFKGGGYAVLGADARQGHVVALVDKGHMSARTLVEAKQSYDANEGNVDLPAYINGMVAAGLVESLNRELQPADIADQQTRGSGWTPIDPNAPMLKTEWTQWAPYNKFYYSLKGQDRPVGCVAQSLAQVLIYNKKMYGVGPSVIDNRQTRMTDDPIFTAAYYPNWSKLIRAIETPTPASDCIDEVSRLLYEVGKAVKMNYGASESTTDYKNTAKFLQKIPGYKNAEARTANIADIKTMLNNDTPVCIHGGAKGDFYCNGQYIGSGNKHTWVIDGEKQIIDRFVGGQSGVIETVHNCLHARFGYGGELDGWYEHWDSGSSWSSDKYSMWYMTYYTL